MVSKIILWYLIGVFLSYPLLLIANTLCTKYKRYDDKAPIKFIFYSFILAIITIIYICAMLYNHSKAFEKFKDYMNSEPDLNK